MDYPKIGRWLLRHTGALALGSAAGALFLWLAYLASTITSEYPRTLAQFAGLVMFGALAFVIIFAYAAILGGPAIYLLQRFSRITLPRLLALGWMVTLPFEIYWTALMFDVAKSYDETQSKTLIEFALEPDQFIQDLLLPAVATGLVVFIYWFIVWRRRV